MGTDILGNRVLALAERAMDSSIRFRHLDQHRQQLTLGQPSQSNPAAHELMSVVCATPAIVRYIYLLKRHWRSRFNICTAIPETRPTSARQEEAEKLETWCQMNRENRARECYEVVPIIAQESAKSGVRLHLERLPKISNQTATKH